MVSYKEKPNNENLSILVVDDFQQNREYLTDILDEAGYRIYEADSGEAALTTAVDNLVDMVLLDIRMPGMDGYEVCQRLKEKRKLSNVPIIFVTALDDSADKLRAFAAGGVDYVTKPFDPDEVLARVNAHLKIRSYQVELENAPIAAGVRKDYDLGNISLTKREHDCLSLLARGMRNDRISHELNISNVTVEFHLANARRKLDSATREQALAIAVQMGLVSA